MAKPLIKLHDVTRTYKLGNETIHALDHVSISVEAGEYLAITGPSGSGKSTLVNMIGGIDSPTSGTISVGGNNLSKLNDDKLSAYRNLFIGYIFQSFNLQETNTVLENVMLPLIFSGVSPSERHKRAVACLEQVGLGHRLHHKPTELSGGQQQLTAIARALVTNPKILIADEPTGNLDSAHSMQIYQILEKINAEGTTILAVTHNVNMANLAKRVVQMNDGRLSELAGVSQ